jgi:hypothetical protein
MDQPGEDTFEVMPVDAFEGGGGHLVLCQEWPSLSDGERYLRIMIPMKNAEALARQILDVARKANGANS